MNDPVASSRAEAGHIPASAYWNGAALYAVWGLAPIYFKLLPTVSPYEVVMHRILWSLFFLGLLCLWTRRIAEVKAATRNRTVIAALLPSAILISVNWLLNVIAVAENHILAISLGYFLTPLVNVGLGIVVLKEKVSRPQIVAIALATIAVVFMAFSALTTLWISLGLAACFGTYGLIRKVAPVGSTVGLTLETALLAPLSLLWLGWMWHDGTMAFGRDLPESLLLVGSGIVLMVPLLFFGVIVRQLPLVAIGLLQYIGPSVQFLIALFLYREPLGLAKLASFVLIWIGLAIFSYDTVRTARRIRRMRPI
ncbi:MAG: EamA family transporter RarD [Sphingobium sp.]